MGVVFRKYGSLAAVICRKAPEYDQMLDAEARVTDEELRDSQKVTVLGDFIPDFLVISGYILP